MDSDKIKELLDKYFTGESSLPEEKLLREYLTANENIPSQFEYARQLFLHFKENSEIKYAGKTIRISAIAAGILLLAGFWLLYKKPAEPTVYAYINGVPVTDKNIALCEARKAFSLVSDNLRTGTKDLSQLSKFNQYRQLIIKTK